MDTLTQMQIESYITLIACFMTFILALMSWMNRRHERINIAFSLLMINLAISELLSFKISLLNNVQDFRFWMKFSFLFNGLEIITIFYFVLVLTGYLNRMDEKILGIKLKHYFSGLVALMITGVFFQISTDFLSESYIMTESGKFDIEWSPFMYPIELIIIVLFYVIFTLLFRAYKREGKEIRKTFLKHQIIGIIIILASGPVLGITIPLLGFDSVPFVNFSIMIASVIFYLSINRYQFETIRELNIGLERKVEDRTRHLRETQAKLVQSEKMAALGRLVAGIAHEINNPVAAVLSSSSTSVKGLRKMESYVEESDSSADERLNKISGLIPLLKNSHQTIEGGSNRVANLVKRMKEFIQLDEPEMKVADMHEGIDSSIELFRNTVEEKITFHKRYGKTPAIRCYPAKLNQLYLQLFDNANKAHSKNITIRTISNSNHITIAVIDDGDGIPEEDLDKIFEPGYTRWSVGVGVGLGLSICYQIVQDHNGTIRVGSKVGEGTVVTVTLPIKPYKSS